MQERSSILNLYHRLIQLRRKEPALSVGDYAAVPVGDDLIAYMRKSEDRRFLVALNFAGQSRSFNLCELQAQSAFLRISTYLDREHERVENELFLRADEGVIVELI
jgi:alpha-glucosidase